MRLGAFITTLNRPLELKRTLQILLSQTRPPDCVVVVDNAPSDETQSVVAGFSGMGVTYKAMSENVGPAGAAAYGLDRLSRQGYEWIYCGDDDDPPLSSDTIERLLDVAVNTGEDTGAVGAVGALWDWAAGETRRVPDKALSGIVSVDMIGGGQHFILRSEMVAKVGLPDARFFFGLDDLEYCLRIRAAGYRLLVDGELMREYRAKKGHLNWSPPRAKLPHHPYESIWRQYYSTRNYIFAMTQTLQHPRLGRRELYKALARTCCSWGRGPRYGFAFTKLQLRGVVDGYLGHMGRTVLPTPKYGNDANSTQSVADPDNIGSPRSGRGCSEGKDSYRILHCLSSLHVGGVGQLVLRNITQIDKRRFESRVCYLTPRRDLEPQFIEAGFTPLCLEHQRKWHGVRTLLQLVKLLRQNRIDLVHTNHLLDRLYVGLAAALCGVPVVTTLHDTTISPDEAGKLLYRARVRAVTVLMDWIGCFLTSRFVAVSEAVRDVYTRHRHVPRDHIEVLYSGVSTREFGVPSDGRGQERLRRELGIEGAYPVLINVGRLAKAKGQVWLVRMMPQLMERWPTARLIIVGEGGERKALEEEIRRHGLGSHVSLVGQRSDVPNLLAVSDVFLFPSVSEGLPLALLEAAASGKPVVASNCGPIGEVVEDGASGYMVEPENPEALAQAVLRVLESPQRARCMGLRGRQIVREKFDIRDSVPALERVYLSILEEYGG